MKGETEGKLTAKIQTYWIHDRYKGKTTILPLEDVSLYVDIPSSTIKVYFVSYPTATIAIKVIPSRSLSDIRGYIDDLIDELAYFMEDCGWVFDPDVSEIINGETWVTLMFIPYWGGLLKIPSKEEIQTILKEWKTTVEPQIDKKVTVGISFEVFPETNNILHDDFPLNIHQWDIEKITKMSKEEKRNLAVLLLSLGASQSNPSWVKGIIILHESDPSKIEVEYIFPEKQRGD